MLVCQQVLLVYVSVHLEQFWVKKVHLATIGSMPECSGEEKLVRSTKESEVGTKKEERYKYAKIDNRS